MKICNYRRHLSPALAVIERLKATSFIIWPKHTLEEIKQFRWSMIDTKIRNSFLFYNTARLPKEIHQIYTAIFDKISIRFSQSLRILRQIKPDVVLGFGGYVSLPVVLAAFFLKIPIIIHEQTLEAGIAKQDRS